MTETGDRGGSPAGDRSDGPSARRVVAVVAGILALAGAAASVVAGVLTVVLAPDGGGVDFRAVYCVLAVAALTPLGLVAIVTGSHGRKAR